MPSAKITYDAEMRKTDHGRRIYAYWMKVKRATDDPEFQTFPGFLKWAMQNGYTLGATLCLHDPFEPYSSDNCFWLAKGEKKQERVCPHDFEREKQWDEVVNRIRLHYGMEPIHSSEV